MDKLAITDSTIGFIGLGLIGGSIARGIKRARPDIRIMAYMRTRSKLEQARADGIVDVILDGIDENLAQCSLIFLCTPVEYNAQYLNAIRPFLSEGALITDVGSTKTSIHEEILRQGLEDRFVGGHPMAGSEKTGYEHSTDHLLENAYYIVTPPSGCGTEAVGGTGTAAGCAGAADGGAGTAAGCAGTADGGAGTAAGCAGAAAGCAAAAGDVGAANRADSFPSPGQSENVRRIVAVAQTIGAIPMVLDYREHDKVVAAISHLPHLVASSLVNLVKDSDSVAGTMKQVAAGGFKDITRIASSSPEMWEQICMTNTEPIADILERYIAGLTQILDQVKCRDGSAVYQLFETSRNYRDSITERVRGSVEPSYEFSVDVADEVGAISTISVILAAKGISIRNIGINNNRERGEGALKIVFYDEASMNAAWKQLDKYKYDMFRV